MAATQKALHKYPEAGIQTRDLKSPGRCVLIHASLYLYLEQVLGNGSEILSQKAANFLPISISSDLQSEVNGIVFQLHRGIKVNKTVLFRFVSLD